MHGWAQPYHILFFFLFFFCIFCKAWTSQKQLQTGDKTRTIIFVFGSECQSSFLPVKFYPSVMRTQTFLEIRLVGVDQVWRGGVNTFFFPVQLTSCSTLITSIQSSNELATLPEKPYLHPYFKLLTLILETFKNQVHKQDYSISSIPGSNISPGF